MNVIELGGGERPRYHPNLDVRQVPGVDMVVDFEKPIPLPSESVDLIYSQYMVEHLGWRKVGDFLKECHRILREGGKVLFFVPNLKEQARVIVSKEKMTMEDVERVFGSQEFEGSAGVHKSSMDPGLMEQLLRQAGFSRVEISPHLLSSTDMVAEAWR